MLEAYDACMNATGLPLSEPCSVPTVLDIIANKLQLTEDRLDQQQSVLENLKEIGSAFATVNLLIN